ncbi:hypothetical protein CPter91_5436 [Collimonas pratensis]|uniref:Uncharacterized protein n=1 Tax=Collimonas pratensis TaxID=279113 RepID=A0A127QCC7_9BURK|nr:hypothetical protein CPter91_5436 [Collimonas pratensis]
MDLNVTQPCAILEQFKFSYAHNLVSARPFFKFSEIFFYIWRTS